jgi:hypothetical protein
MIKEKLRFVLTLRRNKDEYYIPTNLDWVNLKTGRWDFYDFDLNAILNLYYSYRDINKTILEYGSLSDPQLPEEMQFSNKLRIRKSRDSNIFFMPINKKQAKTFLNLVEL